MTNAYILETLDMFDRLCEDKSIFSIDQDPCPFDTNENAFVAEFQVKR